MPSAPLPHHLLCADGPTAYFGVFNTVLRHDIGDKKQVGACNGLAFTLGLAGLHRLARLPW